MYIEAHGTHFEGYFPESPHIRPRETTTLFNIRKE